MILLANSNIYVSSFSVFAWFFSSSWTVFSCFFACLLIFLLGTRYCEFYLAGCCILCITTNILELYSGIHLSYLETNVSFQAFCLDLLDGTRAVYSLGLIISYYGGKTLLNTLPCALWLMRFSSLADRTGTTSNPP